MLSRDVVDRLLDYRSDEAPVISLYLSIPADPGELKGSLSALHALVKPLRELLDLPELSHQERESVRQDIARLLELQERVQEFKGHALAVFTCSRTGLYEEVDIPRRVRSTVMVDATPYLRPLLAVLDESHRFCVVVVDREKAWLYEFFMGQLEDARKLRGRALRQPNYAGGWQGYREHTTHNKAEMLARRHFRETAEAVSTTMARTGAELVLVGGHEDVVAEFLPFLAHDVQPKVAGTFVVDPSTMSPGRLREQAEQLVNDFERAEEARLVAEALDRAGAGGLGAVGIEWCLLAVDEQAVELLLVHDDEELPGRMCDNCGWLGLDGEECPVCSHATHKTPDVIDEMAAAVVATHGRVEHVRTDTPLAQHTVAAFLRFPVPRP